MSTTIQIKRSSTASAVPLTGDLAVGELAVNLADKRLFAKQADGTIIELSTNPTDLDAATLRIDGVEITASATELNSLDGLTATTAELNILDGVTATATEINVLDGITSTTTELNKLDGFTGSTAELNLLDGVTATTAELNTLDGITSTTAELNILDGVTATASEINVTDGLTASTSELNILDGATLSTTELNLLDGVTASTAELNITDGLTATTTELNTLDGITASTTELNYTDGVTSNIQTQLNGKATSAQGALADSAVQPDDNVSFGTGSFSGEIAANGGIALGDNDKATFGASDDLQIYHDGSNSYIKDSGTGDLYLQGSSAVQIEDASGTNMIYALSGDTVQLFHNGSNKLATTSTGVDVTGTVTADGLVVANTSVVAGDFDGGTAATYIRLQDDTDNFLYGTNNGLGGFLVKNETADALRMLIANTGDVHLFEDTGTTAKFVWDASAESLGIGTSSPNTTLHTTGSLTVNDKVYLQRASSSLFLPIASYWDGTGSPLTGNKGDIVAIGNAGGDGLVLVNSGTERMRIDSAGNVALTGNEQELKFHSDYAIGNTDRAKIKAIGAGGGSGYGGDLTFHTKNPSNVYSERMRIDSAGNVGIGTEHTPNALNIYKSGGTTVNISAGSNDAGTKTRLGLGSYVFNGEGGSAIQAETYHAGTSATTLEFFTSGGERARIDSSGNLLVGTTTSGGVGTTISKAASGPLTVYNQSYGNGWTNVSFRFNGAQVGQIYSNTSSTVFATSSDYRLKENVVTMENASDRVKALKPCRFNFISYPDTTVDGFLAHEAQEVVPEAVTGTKDAVDAEGKPEYQGIDQSKLVPLLTKALQEAITKIEQLETRIETLENN